MIYDLSNLHMVTPYISTDKMTGANSEGLAIANIGSSNLPTTTHNFKVQSV